MEDSNKNLKNTKFLAKLIIGGILFLVIFGLLEYFVFQLLNLVFYYKFIAVFACFIIHYMLARYLVLSALFPGSNFVFKKFFIFENGKTQARHFLKFIIALKNNLKILNTQSIVKLKSDSVRLIRNNLMQTLDAMKYYVKIFNDMRIKYKKLSPNQNKFSECLTSFKEIMDASGLAYTIKEAYEKVRNNEDDFDYLKTDGSDIHLIKLISHLDSIESMINQFLLKKSLSKNIQSFWRNDVFGSVRQLRIEMNMHYNIEEYSVPTKDKKHNIEIIVLKSEAKENLLEINSNSNSKFKPRNLMIICGPNGVPYENYSRNIRLDELYLEQNIDVLLWNYRGFGTNQGLPSFKNIKTDADAILEFVKEKNQWNKIGVYGLSMGGLPCCHLGSTNKVDVCIVDRTFSSIDDVIMNFTCGSYLHILYKILFFEHTNNVENFINTKCNKILLNDPHDTIINDMASLKTGIAKRAIKNLFKDKIKDQIFLDKNNKGILMEIMDSDECESFKGSLINLFNNITLLNKTDSSSNFFQMQNLNKKGKIISSESEGKRYVRLDSPGVDSFSNIDYATSLEEDNTKLFNSFKIVAKEVMSAMSEFESAGDSMSALSDIKDKKTKDMFIEIFFNNLLIWGCLKSNEREDSDKVMSHEEIFRKFQTIITRVEAILNANDLNDTKYKFIISDLKIFINGLHKIKNSFFRLIFKGDINFDERTTIISYINKVNEIEKLDLGILLPICCGHNGSLSETEFSCLKYELYKISFITN